LGRYRPDNEDLGLFDTMDHIDREGAKDIVNKITRKYNIKIDDSSATYHNLSKVFKGDILLKFINQIECLVAMGSRTNETYEKCNNNMEECAKEMKIAKDNAQLLKTVLADTLSAINVFKEDDILKRAIIELQVSPSDQETTTKTYDIKIENQDASYHELATFFKREIISQFINQIGDLAALGSSLHEAHENFKKNMEVFEHEMKFERDNAKKLKTVSADTLSSIELFKNDEKLQRDLRTLQASTYESVSGDAGDGNQAPANPLAQASSEQEKLNQGKYGDKNKKRAHGKEDKEEGSEK